MKFPSFETGCSLRLKKNAACHNPLPAWDAPVHALRLGEGTTAAYVFQDGNLITDFGETA